ncbi:DUF2127 domain-containing protein [Patescibacteria group bacterium]|nr:DUF2127 domain-containing protein [Patescibacteria group bacterium]
MPLLTTREEEKNIRRVFIASVFLKAVDAALEIVIGTLLLFTGEVVSVIEYLVRGELIEDPHDFLASAVQQYVPYLSEHSQLFAATYLLSHGIIKIFLAVGLLRNKLWAYPSAIVVFVLFIIYQLYRYAYTHSNFLMLLTVFDVIVIWLTWHEYTILKRRAERRDEPRPEEV